MHFRRDQELQDIFLIAISGYALPDDLEKSRAVGFNRHLAKPVDLDILKQTLDEVPDYIDIIAVSRP